MPGGKAAVVGVNHGTINLGEGKTLVRRFVDVPPPRPLFGRDDALAELRDRVCGSGLAAISALNGLPGVGKTALAVALAHDARIQEHFRGGVLWAGLGPNGDPNSALNRWGDALGVDLGAAPDASTRARMLSVALQEKVAGAPVLLVVDDAWRWEQVQPFREITFPGCAHVVTTRDAEISRRFGGEATRVAVWSDDVATAFLGERCPRAREVDPEGLRALAKAVGGLPLGLTLMAGELGAHAEQARWVRAALERLEAVEARLALEAVEGYAGLEGVPNTLGAIVELSVVALDAEAQRAFVALGAFAAKPADFGREAALAVGEMGERGDAVLRLLVTRGLVEIAGEDRFALHQVVAAVAAARLGEERGARERHAGAYLEVIEANRENWQQIESELGQIRHAWGCICGHADMRVVALEEAIRHPGLEADRVELARLRAKRRALSRIPWLLITLALVAAGIGLILFSR